MLAAFFFAFMPAAVAKRRRHNSAVAIFTGCLLLEIGNVLVTGFTVVAVAYLWMPIFAIFWAVLLVWSTTSNTRPREIIVEKSRISVESPQERWQKMNAG
jgi:hypothetical protein